MRHMYSDPVEFYWVLLFGLAINQSQKTDTGISNYIQFWKEHQLSSVVLVTKVLYLQFCCVMFSSRRCWPNSWAAATWPRPAGGPARSRSRRPSPTSSTQKWCRSNIRAQKPAACSWSPGGADHPHTEISQQTQTYTPRWASFLWPVLASKFFLETGDCRNKYFFLFLFQMDHLLSSGRFRTYSDSSLGKWLIKIKVYFAGPDMNW